MLQACHNNVVQTHHVLMWQRAKAVIDDCANEGFAQPRDQHVLPAFGNSSSNGASPVPAAAVAADAISGGTSPQGQGLGERRFSNLHVDNSNAGGTSACGVLEFSAAESEAADGWPGAAGMLDDDEDELEAQTCELSWLFPARRFLQDVFCKTIPQDVSCKHFLPVFCASCCSCWMLPASC
jgi:hypothetical protein